MNCPAMIKDALDTDQPPVARVNTHTKLTALSCLFGYIYCDLSNSAFFTYLKSSVLSHSYNSDRSISVLRVVGW